MKLYQKIVAYILAGCLLMAYSLPLAVQAAEPGMDPEVDIYVPGESPEIEITAESAVVMDLDSGYILFEKDSLRPFYPASITKIMTALLALENSAMDEEVLFSHDSVWNIEGSHIWRSEGEILTMEQALHGLMLNSANDCAYAIAEHVGGTYENFIQMMNDKAASLGATDTVFKNPHGLPDEGHVVSSHDMALIARAAFQNETFRALISTERYIIPPTNLLAESTYLRNGHKMIREGGERYYPGTIGGKTGYTEAAGNTLVTFVERDGIRLVSVVLGDTNPEHYLDTMALLDYSFANYGTLHPVIEDVVVDEATGEALPEDARDGVTIQEEAVPSSAVTTTNIINTSQYRDSILWLVPAAILPLGIAVVLVFVKPMQKRKKK